MRSTIDARGSTVTAAAALLIGLALIAGGLLRGSHPAPSVDVVSWTVPATAQSHDVAPAVRHKTAAPALRVRRRVTPIRFPSPNQGAPEDVGVAALDDLALPSLAAPAVSAAPLLQPEPSNGLAAAANDFGDSLARGSQKAGARTAGFFKRFGKKVAASFGR